MRIPSFVVFALPILTSGSYIGRDANVETVAASPASVVVFDSPVATVGAGLDVLELRQAPAIIPTNVPGDTAAPVGNQAPTVAANPTSPTVVLTTSTTLSSSSISSTRSSLSSPSTITSSINTNIGQPLNYTTTKWVETWVGGTYSTWTPTVITVIHKTPAPAPPLWKGEIGMGSLTGETGKTQTIYMGAAPSEAAGWARGVAAAVGVGIAGMVV